jgi:hypothetical protein
VDSGQSAKKPVATDCGQSGLCFAVLETNLPSATYTLSPFIQAIHFQFKAESPKNDEMIDDLPWARGNPQPKNGKRGSYGWNFGQRFNPFASDPVYKVGYLHGFKLL